MSGRFVYCWCFSVYSVMLSFLCLEGEHDDVGRVAGTVRRYIPVDTRDPHGAILHFYVGDAYDSGRYMLFHMFNYLAINTMSEFLPILTGSNYFLPLISLLFNFLYQQD